MFLDRNGWLLLHVPVGKGEFKMIFALTFALTALAPAVAPQEPDQAPPPSATAPIPPATDQAPTPRSGSQIRVSLDPQQPAPGDPVRVTVSTSEDGYVVVLRADADGRVRVLFPIDPGVDNFVQANGEQEIQGRGGREAFTE